MFDTSKVKSKMGDVVERFRGEMSKVRTGRAHPDMLGGVKVEAYGQFMPLNQVANVVVADGTLLTVMPFDPANLAKIVEAIRSDQSLGLNPADDGRIIRVPIPALTEERRREIVRAAAAKVEEAKIGIRGCREDGRKEVKGMELAEDARKRAEKEIDDLTKEFTGQVEEMFRAKEAEIMKI